MAFTTADFVKETSTTTGTGTYDLAGASTGFRTFVSGIGSGNSCWYSATDGVDWEVGIGTVTDASPDTLSRTTILSSSNAGSAVNWGAGTRVLRCTLPASAVTGKGLSNLQAFTAVGANTWSNNLTVGGSIIVECIGGGGGGIGSGVAVGLGSGGGAGGYCRKRIAASALGATETVTVGSGGAGGVSGGGNPGSAGGSTTFGSHCTACGGAGGITGAAAPGTADGASGGLATSGDINIQGGDGGAGGSLGTSAGNVAFIWPGDGGDSLYGSGGRAQYKAFTGATAVGGPGVGHGGGGAGSAAGTAGGSAGGAGAGGLVIVWEFA